MLHISQYIEGLEDLGDQDRVTQKTCEHMIQLLNTRKVYLSQTQLTWLGWHNFYSNRQRLTIGDANQCETISYNISYKTEDENKRNSIRHTPHQSIKGGNKSVSNCSIINSSIKTILHCSPSIRKKTLCRTWQFYRKRKNL